MEFYSFHFFLTFSHFKYKKWRFHQVNEQPNKFVMVFFYKCFTPLSSFPASFSCFITKTHLLIVIKLLFFLFVLLSASTFNNSFSFFILHSSPFLTHLLVFYWILLFFLLSLFPLWYLHPLLSVTCLIYTAFFSLLLFF